MEGERKGTLGRSRGTWGKHPRATETNDGRLCGVYEKRRESGERRCDDDGARAKLREGEMRERASSSEGFKYKDTEACAVLSY